MGPFLWAWHPISTAALVQCPPIAGNVNDTTQCILHSLLGKKFLIKKYCNVGMTAAMVTGK